MWNAKSTFISLVASISSKVPALHRRTIQPLMYGTSSTNKCGNFAFIIFLL